MKVAVLLCGQARFFRQGFESIRKHVLDVYNPDIYIHTWKSETNTFEAAPWNHLGQLMITDNDLREYIQLYSPKRWRIDYVLKNIPLRESYTRTSSPETRYNYYSYLYSLRSCYELVQEQYDMFLILRSDVILFRMPTLIPNKIHIWDRLPQRKNVLEAMVCVVPQEYIDVFTRLIFKLEEYYDKGYDFNYEEMTHAHFQESGFYSYTLRLPTSAMEWGYYRGNRIERMS